MFVTFQPVKGISVKGISRRLFSDEPNRHIGFLAGSVLHDELFREPDEVARTGAAVVGHPGCLRVRTCLEAQGWVWVGLTIPAGQGPSRISISVSGSPIGFFR
jgi:hypothetical protein